MIVDCHVHVSALLPQHGRTTARLQSTPPFRFMRWRLGFTGTDQKVEAKIEETLARLLDRTPELDAAVILAFDAVHDGEGCFDDERTHLHVTNDYVIELCRRHPKMLFGASIHPYRKDAVAELERCVAAGAVLIKWLPITQGFNPADPRCEPFYEAMAGLGIPLLSHTGWEKSLPNVSLDVADPKLLLPALKHGVTVIAAHCGTRSVPSECCFVDDFMRMAKDHERLFGDTSALNLPTRCYAWRKILADDEVRAKLVHGSDWPIIALPHPGLIGMGATFRAMKETNWIRRDVLIKKELGLDDAYWRRGATLLRRNEKLLTGSQELRNI